MAHQAKLQSGATDRAPARDTAEMDEQKRSFLRMASHELRTPLNSILGFSEILATELYGPLGSPQYKEYAEIIHGSGRKLLRLVNQVLEIARLDGRATDFVTRAEPLGPAFDNVLETLAPDLAARGVTVEIARRAGLPTVVADSRGLRTVLLNLLQNAIAFSPQGGVVRVETRTAGADVEIRIHDDGEGVDPDEIPRLMAPFEQGENALTRRSEGAGLGLPISDMTCRAMGGRLWLDSRPDAGLTATVRLPAA
jgi:signal transduction histidine kinase